MTPTPTAGTNPLPAKTGGDGSRQPVPAAFPHRQPGQPAMTTNRLIAAATQDNSKLIREFGADLHTMPALWGRYERNRQTIAAEQAKAAAKRKEIAAC